MLSLNFLVFRERVLLCVPGQPKTSCVSQISFKFMGRPASASWIPVGMNLYAWLILFFSINALKRKILCFNWCLLAGQFPLNPGFESRASFLPVCVHRRDGSWVLELTWYLCSLSLRAPGSAPSSRQTHQGSCVLLAEGGVLRELQTAGILTGFLCPIRWGRGRWGWRYYPSGKHQCISEFCPGQHRSQGCPLSHGRWGRWLSL